MIPHDRRIGIRVYESCPHLERCRQYAYAVSPLISLRALKY